MGGSAAPHHCAGTLLFGAEASCEADAAHAQVRGCPLRLRSRSCRCLNINEMQQMIRAASLPGRRCTASVLYNDFIITYNHQYCIIKTCQPGGAVQDGEPPSSPSAYGTWELEGERRLSHRGSEPRSIRRSCPALWAKQPMTARLNRSLPLPIMSE